MNPLIMIKSLFELRGLLSGYKTYLSAFAGICAVCATFVTGSVMPFIDGDISAMLLLTDRLPQFIEQVALFFAAGALRVGLRGEIVK